MRQDAFDRWRQNADRLPTAVHESRGPRKITAAAGGPEDLWIRAENERVTEEENENLQIVQTMIQNGILGRWDVVRPHVSDEVVCNLPEGLPYGRTYRGWQGYVDVLTELTTFWRDVKFGPNEFIVGKNKVVILSRIQGLIAKNGQAVSMPLTEIWELQHAKVTSITAFYFDTKSIAELAAR